MTTTRLRQGWAIAAAVGLVLSLSAAAPAAAAAKKTTKKAAKKVVKKTTKKAVKTTKKATSNAGGAANKGTIKLGTLWSSISSTTGAKTLEEAKKVAQVWVDTANAAGGVNGYKIELVARDNKNDIARGAANVKELESAGVLAIIGADAAAQISASDKLLQDKGLPYLGGVPYTPEFDDHPMFFPVSAGFTAGVYGQVAAARDAGAKHFRSLSCSEVAACSSSGPARAAAGQREGVKVTEQLASAVAPDYTANCISAKNDGVDFFQANGTNLANLVRDCTRQNYHPIFAQGGAANQAVIDAAKGEQIVGNLFEFGVFYDGPEVARFRQALGKTDLSLSGTTNPATQTSVQSWIAWEMAGAAINKLTQANPTRQDLVNALYSIKGETLGGQVPPLDYSVQRPGTGLHAGADCWTEQIVKDGKYFHMDTKGQVASRLTFICGTGKTYKIKDYS